MALALETSLGVPELVTGVLMAVIAFLMLIGGIERIARSPKWWCPGDPAGPPP